MIFSIFVLLLLPGIELCAAQRPKDNSHLPEFFKDKDPHRIAMLEAVAAWEMGYRCGSPVPEKYIGGGKTNYLPVPATSSSSDSEDEPIVKLDSSKGRLESNRLSAAKSRAKKKNEHEKLLQENQQLKYENLWQRIEIERLQSIISGYGPK